MHSLFFASIIILMLSCKIALPQNQPPLPNAQSLLLRQQLSVSLLQKILDMSVMGITILTAHSSQLTAHSVRAYSLHSKSSHSICGNRAAGIHFFLIIGREACKKDVFFLRGFLLFEKYRDSYNVCDIHLHFWALAELSLWPSVFFSRGPPY